MKLRYASRRLREASLSIDAATKAFGRQAGRKYIQRIGQIRASPRFHNLYDLRSLRFHPLAGSGKGQYAMNITGNFRLVLEQVTEEEVRITNVEDYHGN